MSKNDVKKFMISLECVDRLKWSLELGRRLQSLRGSTTMRALAETVNKNGITITHQYIHKLEAGKVDAVSVDLLIAICEALSTDFKKLFPGVYLDISELLMVSGKKEIST